MIIIYTFEKEENVNLYEKICSIVSEKRKGLPKVLKKAYELSAYFLLKEIEVDETELIVGQVRVRKEYSHANYPLGIAEEIEKICEANHKNYSEYENILSANDMKLLFRSPGGHVVPGYDWFLNKGFDKVIKKIVNIMKKCDKTDESYPFYEAELLLARAAQKCILRYAGEISKIEVSKMKSKNKMRIIDACNSIAHNQPRNFFEAVQLLWFLHEFCLEDTTGCVISVGRIDQFLYPYYCKDVSQGRLDYEEAYAIIEALWKKFAKYDHGFQNIALGGMDEFGKDMSNELTIMCMQASLSVRAEQPAIILRTHKNMQKKVWDKAFELIQSGLGMPALFNDEVAIKAKINAGIDQRHAQNYSVVGCVELTIGGMEYSHTEGLRINWLKILELMLFHGECPITHNRWKLKEEHNLEEFSDFKDFFLWYKLELVHVLNQACEFIQLASEEYAKNWPIPFVSLLMIGCLEKGRDVTDRGTLYNNLSVNSAGMANVVDSLEAIENLVFKERLISLNEVPDILKVDFEGYEDIRKKVLSYPKFGNNIDSVDNKMQQLIKLFCDTLDELKCCRGGKFQAGFYTVQVHGLMGQKTGASMDGRKRGMALANSLSPAQGQDKMGPTSVINSINKIPMDRFGNGMVLDMKFTPNFLQKKNHLAAVKNMVDVYFERGGLEIQFNVVDRQTLLDAQNNPENYLDLIVRVSGYSAYFIALNRTLQNEIIMRTAWGE